ncbi:MAG: hypothetical protein LPK25_04210 [Cyclobacteriaceae bacterium]|nr:hypothetical protein [Cyclobacteriaceae bacterium]MDX5465958.1 hypothetical protein [Cyclobacteriaceae bacterium]
MKKINLILVVLGFGVGALGHWTADFSEDRALFDSLYYIKAPGAIILALIFGFIRRKEPSLNSLLISFGVILGMSSRILSDIIQDPSSHSLFPFELLIGLVVILPATFLASYLVYGVFLLAAKE